MIKSHYILCKRSVDECSIVQRLCDAQKCGKIQEKEIQKGESIGLKLSNSDIRIRFYQPMRTIYYMAHAHAPS